MSALESRPEAWVAAAVKELREQHSWTGRTHIHKLLAIMGTLELADVPFEFELYYYGPYSRDMDFTIAEMEADGLLSKEYSKPGYGPKYNTSSVSVPKLDKPTDLTAIHRAAKAIGARDSKELELIATCLWVEKRENVLSDEKIAARVQELKPKYTPLEIKQHIKLARQLEKSLTS